MKLNIIAKKRIKRKEKKKKFKAEYNLQRV